MSDTSLAMMPWFPRDFIAATRAMRLAERGAYRELLDYQWEMGKLPAEHDRLARLLGVSLAEFGELWPAIQDKFVLNGTGLYNKRLEEHRKRALEQRDKKRNAAARTNAKRYGERGAERSLSDTDTDSHSDTLSASPPSPSPSPSPIEEEDTSAERARVSPKHIDGVFRHWQNVHGHPGSKLDSKRRAAIARALKDYTYEQLCRSIDGYKLSPHHTGDNERGVAYDDIELMCRDAKRVEQGLAFLANPPKETPRGTHQPNGQPRLSTVERVKRANEAWLAEGETPSSGGVVIDA